MDVTRFKKVSSFAGGLVLAMAISAPASAAWTQVPIPAQYSSSIASLRLCKSPRNEVPAYPAWQVNSQLTRITNYVSKNTITTRRFVGSFSFPIVFFSSTTFDSTNTASVGGYGTASFDDRYVTTVGFSDGTSFQFPALKPSQIADC